MPKEAKKFINPLLRPSQPLEARQDRPAEPERQSGSVRKNAGMSTPIVVDEAPPVEVPPTKLPPDLADLSDMANTSEQPEISTETRQVQELVVAPPVSTLESPRSVESTFLSTRPEESIANEEKTGLPSSQLSPTELIHNFSALAKVENRSSAVDPRSAYAPVPVVSPPPVEEMETFTYTSPAKGTPSVSLRPGYPSTEQVNMPLVDEDEGVQDLPAAPRVPVTRAGRRRRGELAFEKTHERITLWIDKRLKQAFEELAYQQELPKTTLLNEAVADLLRKYEMS